MDLIHPTVKHMPMAISAFTRLQCESTRQIQLHFVGSLRHLVPE